MTYYLLVSFTIVLALSLEARWVVRALAAPEFFDAYQAIPLVATGVTLYALYLVLSVAVGRVGRTEYNFPVTGVALAVNLGLNLLLIPPYGIVGAGHRAGRRVPADGRPHVPGHAPGVPARPRVGADRADRRRSPSALFAAGELLLPDSGAVGFVARAALVPLFWALLYATGFFHPAELEQLRLIRARVRAALQPLRGGAGGPRSPAHPHGADGRGARRRVARPAPMRPVVVVDHRGLAVEPAQDRGRSPRRRSAG